VLLNEFLELIETDFDYLLLHFILAGFLFTDFTFTYQVAND
jgi:hypothetical protein